MKKIKLLTAVFLFCNAMQAQEWAPLGRPRKLEDIIASHKKAQATESEEDGKGKDQKEGKNYHFDRWAWYWQHHLDEDGYLASPVRTFEEWQSYTKRTATTLKRFKTTDQSQWTFVGPTTSTSGYRGIGRINVVEFHPTDTNTFIIGAAGGGAWITTDHGVTWTCLTDDLPVLGMSDVDYNPLNPNTIYLCTGDRDASDTYSIGVLKSTDGGLTWNTTGIQFSRSNLKLTSSLVINPLDTNSLTLGTSDGIMKSYDGGATWATKATGNFKQVLYHPTDTNILYAATAGFGSSNIYRSADGGETWQQSTSFGSVNRIVLAVTPADPGIVKAIMSNLSSGLQGIYNSTDTGKTFVNIYGNSIDCSTNILNGSMNPNSNSCDGQGWYDLALAISPVDPNKVFAGGINTYQSDDGGASWTIVNHWVSSAPGVKTVHADKHYLIFHPLEPDILFECNDGGIYITASPTTLWTDLSNGLGITQFYRNAVADGSQYVIGGSQDNGSKRLTFTGVSKELTGGDGMDCQFDYSTPTTFYTSTQYGNFSRTTNNGNNFNNISGNIPGQPDGAWITPLIIHPTDPNTIFAGYAHVFMSQDQGDSWVDISSTLSTTTNITRMSMTPADPNVIYVLQGTNIRYTQDLGNTWSPVPFGYSGTISDILADPKDKDHIWVTYSGYGATKVAEYHIGGSWSKMNDSLPNIPVQCIAIDTSNGTLYAGTDIGVFYRDNSMTQWTPYNTDLPAIEVVDLGINYATNEIWAATYGRGMWKSPRHLTSPSGVGNLPLALDVISVAPNPSNGSFTILTTHEALRNQQVSIRIVSFSGATAMQTEGKFDEAGRLPVNAGNLSRGTYIVEVNKSGNLFARTKIVIR